MNYNKKINLIFLIMSIVFLNLTNCKAFIKNKSCSVDSNTLLVDSAENLIIEGKIKEAHQIYLKYEKTKNYMFAVDLNNALICAVSLKDWKSAYNWSIKLIYKGVSKSYFDKPVFYDYKKTRYWKKINNSFTHLEKEFLKTINKPLLNALNDLKSKDQDMYCLIPKGKASLEDAYKATYSIDSLLVNLIKKHGFPSEEQVGVNYSEKTKKISPIPKFSGLFRHSYQSNSKLTAPYIEEALINGRLKKNQYDFFTDDASRLFVIIDCKIYEKKQLSSIDSIKAKESRKKVIFSNKPKEDENNYYIIYEPLESWKIDLEAISTSDFQKYFSFVTNYSDCNQ